MLKIKLFTYIALFIQKMQHKVLHKLKVRRPDNPPPPPETTRVHNVKADQTDKKAKDKNMWILIGIPVFKKKKINLTTFSVIHNCVDISSCYLEKVGTNCVTETLMNSYAAVKLL